MKDANFDGNDDIDLIGAVNALTAAHNQLAVTVLKLENQRTVDSGLLTALIETHPQIESLRDSWLRLSSALQAHFALDLSMNPKPESDLKDAVLACRNERIAFWQGVLNKASGRDDPEAGHIEGPPHA